MPIPLSPRGHRYSYRPSLPDALTPRFKITTPVAIPPRFDLTANCGPVKDQGQLGKCTGSSGSGYLEYLYRAFKGVKPIFSDVDLYYKERQMDGDLGQGDTGSFGGTAVKVINQYGVCETAVETRDNSTFEQAPTPAQIANAAQWKAGAYHAMDIPAIRYCIASSYPVLIGISVYESFEEGDWGPNFIMPEPTGSLLGGHELYAKGYDDSLGAYSVRNSWGESWGIKGDFWLPYSLLPNILSEARMQHFGKPW